MTEFGRRFGLTYRLKQDPDSIAKARSLLMPEMADPEEAWELPDEQVIRYADAMLNTVAGHAAALTRQLRPIGHAAHRTPLGKRLGRLLGTYPPLPASVYERLHEIAEQA